jgi:arylsulfatase
MGDWKIASHDRGPWELYNMAVDRTEVIDRAAKDKERLEAMVKRWNELHAETSRSKDTKSDRKARRKRKKR